MRHADAGVRRALYVIDGPVSYAHGPRVLALALDRDLAAAALAPALLAAALFGRGAVIFIAAKPIWIIFRFGVVVVPSTR